MLIQIVSTTLIHLYFLATIVNTVHSISAAPLVLLISLDGLRYDFITPDLTPNIWKLAEAGVFAPQGIQSQVMTVTTPNHHCLATGLYQESHGLIENVFYDPEFGEHFDNWNITNNRTRAERSLSARWFQMGVPLWRANMKINGRLSGSLAWPLGEAEFVDKEPAHMFTAWRDHGNFSVWAKEIDQVIDWFTDSRNPTNLVMYYISEPDHAEHSNDLEGARVEAKVREVDSALGYLIKRLNDTESLRGKINLILTADHGHSTVPSESYVFNISKYIDLKRVIQSGPSLFPKVDLGVTEDEIFLNLTRAQREGIHIQIWKKNDFPEKYHYKNNRRVGPVLYFWNFHYVNKYRPIDPHTPAVKYPFGTHGYLNDLADMKPFFVAHGPAFKAQYTIDGDYVQNIDIYPLVCKILGLLDRGCGPHNGSLVRIGHILSETMNVRQNSGYGENQMMTWSFLLTVFCILLPSAVLFVVFSLALRLFRHSVDGQYFCSNGGGPDTKFVNQYRGPLPNSSRGLGVNYTLLKNDEASNDASFVTELNFEHPGVGSSIYSRNLFQKSNANNKSDEHQLFGISNSSDNDDL